VGTYDIVAGTGNLTATKLQLRYHQRRADGRQALLTVAANSQTGSTRGNPALTYTYSGWLDGDDTNVLRGAPSLSTSAGNQQPGRLL